MHKASVASTQLEGLQYFGNNKASHGPIAWCHYITYWLLIPWSYVKVFRILWNLLDPGLHESLFAG
jgi:hypothetical protein